MDRIIDCVGALLENNETVVLVGYDPAPLHGRDHVSALVFLRTASLDAQKIAGLVLVGVVP